jgi:hypothetical protein
VLSNRKVATPLCAPLWTGFTTTNGNAARDRPPSPGSDHTRPGERMSVPPGGTKSRTTGTRWSPEVKKATVKPGKGVGRLGQPRLEPETAEAAIDSVPWKACRAARCAPTGRK